MAERMAMARVFARLELVGALLISAWLAFPGDLGLNKGWLAAVVLVSVAQAVAIGLAPRPLSLGTFSLMLAVVVLLLGVGVYFSGAALSPGSLFYLWVVAFSGWYLPLRYLLIQVLWIVTSYGLVLTLHRESGDLHWWQISDTNASRWLLLAGTVIAAGFLVRTFRDTFLENEQQFSLGFERSSVPTALADLNGRIIRANQAYCELLGWSVPEIVGVSVAEISHPADRGATRRFYERGETARQVEQRLLKRDGSAVWVLASSSLVTSRRGQPLHYVGHALDITDRREAEQRLKLQAARQSALAEISHAALEEQHLNLLSERVASVAARLLGVKFAAVLEHDAEGDELRLIAGHGLTAGCCSGRIPSAEWPLARLALAEKRAVVVADWEQETRCARSRGLHALHTSSAIAVPVQVQGGAFGVIMGESDERRRFDAEDADFLRALASLLAGSIEQRRAQDEINHRAMHDSLTGLPNRFLLADLLRHALAQARKPGTCLAVLVLDLDRLKLVNDEFGHAIGDELLREVVARVGAGLRASDIVARLSADEFAIVYDDLRNERAAIRAAERVLAALAPPFSLRGEEVAITATIGIALAAGDATPDSVLRDAEAAMYRGKERSRGSFELFDPEIHERNSGRLRTENALRRAVDARELTLAYQPMVDLSDERIVGVEALVRWRHPDWGPISPVEFIPIAEESGIIIPIGRHVLTEGVRQLEEWAARGHPVHVALNVSARQLYDDALVELTRATLRHLTVPASRLTLELTETAIVADSDVALDVLRALKALGLQLALDDFGTGYASLSYLSRFPFDTIKLDRTLIRMMGRSFKDDIIVASTIEMSHALGLTVVAEGVETREQVARLCELGCDLAQGYYYARPMPAPELQQLAAWRAEAAPAGAANGDLSHTERNALC